MLLNVNLSRQRSASVERALLWDVVFYRKDWCALEQYVSSVEHDVTVNFVVYTRHLSSD
jgi:hypothetical protein